MKSKIVLSGILLAMALLSCDKIEGPYREAVVAPDFCATGIDDSIPNKKVLVEDYTGHVCGNCPEAGIFLNDTLKQIYNHCIVVVSVHAGFFAGTCPTAFACPGSRPPGSYTTDFNTPSGNAWNTFFGITGNPKGMVDRIDFPNGTHSKAFSAWSSAIANQLELPVQAKLSITNSYNSSSNSVNVAIDAAFTENLTGDYKLQVVITEDSVIDWQVWYHHTPEHVPDYVHRHVLRDVLNTTWGEDIASGNIASGTTVARTYSYAIPAGLNVDHCNIVAFIYDATTYEVLQVEEQAVK